MVMEEGQGVTLVTLTGEGDSGKGSSCHTQMTAFRLALAVST